ncbi:MAG: hypothetical protein AB7T22_06525 [Calditrichaceae bacterium]
MRKALFYLISLLLPVSILLAGIVFSEYSAVPTTDKVTVSWVTSSEEGVRHFIILKSTTDRDFVELKRVKPRGPGTSYDFIDENVMFKSGTALFYKIKAVGENDTQIEETDSMIVHPNISGVFRTWGAIKAMFR